MFIFSLSGPKVKGFDGELQEVILNLWEYSRKSSKNTVLGRPRDLRR